MTVALSASAIARYPSGAAAVLAVTLMVLPVSGGLLSNRFANVSLNFRFSAIPVERLEQSATWTSPDG